MLNNLMALFMKLLTSTTDNDIGFLFWSILIIVYLFTIVRKVLFI